MRRNSKVWEKANYHLVIARKIPTSFWLSFRLITVLDLIENSESFGRTLYGGTKGAHQHSSSWGAPKY